MAASLIQSNTLIIDDFPGMRTMLRDFLKAMGVKNMENASNGKEALSLLASKKFDIVICDYNLGQGQNGHQILEEAKQRKYIGYSTIWVMVTAEKTMDMFMGAAETKPDDYLLKPINEALLEARLNKLIAKKQSLESIETAVNAKDYVGAISLCDEQLKAKSTNTQDLLRIKSDLLLTIGDFSAAKAMFEKILAIRNIPWAKTGLGKIHYLSNDFLRAKEIFQEVLEENKMFLEAADWLAKAYEALGDHEQSQQVLLSAMELSPNSPLRQKNLADAAHKNGALDLAQTSYEKAIRLSEHSVHKSSKVYAGLAKVLTDKDSPEEALKVLSRSRGEFKDDSEATLQVAVIESMAYQKMGQSEKAELAIAEAGKLMEGLTSDIGTDITMDMAKVLFQLGEKDKACSLLESVVKNNHENLGIINQVEAVFEKAELGLEGNSLIKKSTQEVIDINNQGVLLAKEGKFEEGIKLLREALQTLPNNGPIITNLCGMLIGLMKKNGKDDRLIYEAREHLEHVRKINPTDKKYHEYINALSQLR